MNEIILNYNTPVLLLVIIWLVYFLGVANWKSKQREKQNKF